MTLLSLVLLVGCKKQSPEVPPAPLEPLEARPTVPAPPVAPPAPAPNIAAPEGLPAVVRALSARDGEPSCAQVESLAAEPVTVLLHVVEHVKMPPMAGMRAAGCLVPHAAEPEVEEAMLTWTTDPAKKGLGALVLQRVAELPLPLAQSLVATAESGVLQEEAKEAAAADPRWPTP